MTLSEIIGTITPGDLTAEGAARAHWDGLAKPLGSLGLLEDAVVSIAALTGNWQVEIQKPALLVFCADNGVVAEGVSQSDGGVTAAVAEALGNGTSTVCNMAKVCGCRVLPVDVGVLDGKEWPGVLGHRIRNGTGNIALGPAMTRRECIEAMELGVSLVKQMKESGCTLLATGEMGIGNTTTTAAVLSVLLDVAPEKLVGRGAGLSDEGLLRKQNVVARAIQVNRPDPNDPIDVLSKLGGLDLAAMCGVFLGGAYYGVPVLLDGIISAAAALCAYELQPLCRKAMVASHVSAEPAGRRVLDALGLRPLITAEMRLGEGTGAVAAIPLLQMALAVYHSGHTFEHLGIDPYTPLGGETSHDNTGSRGSCQREK